MVKLINWYTGSEMYVPEDRVDEYLAAGHKRPVKVEPLKVEKKATPKRSTKTKKAR